MSVWVELSPDWRQWSLCEEWPFETMLSAYHHYYHEIKWWIKQAVGAILISSGPRIIWALVTILNQSSCDMQWNQSASSYRTRESLVPYAIVNISLSPPHLGLYHRLCVSAWHIILCHRRLHVREMKLYQCRAVRASATWKPPHRHDVPVDLHHHTHLKQ